MGGKQLRLLSLFCSPYEALSLGNFGARPSQRSMVMAGLSELISFGERGHLLSKR
jgi:hypothetical protein